MLNDGTQNKRAFRESSWDSAKEVKTETKMPHNDNAML